MSTRSRARARALAATRKLDFDPMSDEQIIDAEVEPEEGTPAPAELDPETRARRDAALRHVRKFGDPVLRTKALAVER